MHDYPEVVDLAHRAQQRLAGFDGLHMTPLPWLHVTTLLTGPAVTVGQVLYHPEAIMLTVTRAETLTAIYDAARWATHQGHRGACTGGPARALETPHHYLLQHV